MNGDLDNLLKETDTLVDTSTKVAASRCRVKPKSQPVAADYPRERRLNK